MNSESDGQQPDPEVQRQFRVGFENADVKLRAVANRGVRNMIVGLFGAQSFCELVGIYTTDPTIDREPCPGAVE